MKKKSLKQKIKDNRGKIIGGISIACCGLCVVLCRDKIFKLEERIYVLEAAVSEGLFEEAIATTTRKLNSRKDRLAYISNKNVVDNVLLDKLKNEIDELTKRRNSFIKAQSLVGIE